MGKEYFSQKVRKLKLLVSFILKVGNANIIFELQYNTTLNNCRSPWRTLAHGILGSWESMDCPSPQSTFVKILYVCPFYVYILHNTQYTPA